MSVNALTSSSGAEPRITGAVRRFYEAFPYPHYPLLAQPHWQDGYWAAPAFAHRLLQDRDHNAPRPPEAPVLVAGCGEIFPYVMRKWVDRRIPVDAVDLSRPSLRRARLRLWRTRGPTNLVVGDISDFLSHRQEEISAKSSGYGHIDAYGLLHHLADPEPVARQMAAALAPGGTLRVMVYNHSARRWIREINRAFSLIGLSPYHQDDLATARHLLRRLSQIAPNIGRKLFHMGSATLTNDARLADTFFHEREAHLSLDRWLEIFAGAGLEPYALFDRYAELDDLPNPMWNPPSLEALRERVADGRFENNLELLLTRKRGPRDGGAASDPTATPPQPPLWRFLTKPPPAPWFRYRETRDMPLLMRWELWRKWLAWVHGGRRVHEEHIWKMPAPCLGRLARLGALLPGQIEDPMLRKKLGEPLTEAMEPPTHHEPAELPTRFVALLQQELSRRGIFTSKRLELVKTRLQRASGGV